ncbi:hypothetical protein Tco_1076110 [Tanacetum coccineum]
MSKVLQERGFGSLPSSIETNPRDQVKSISTAKANFYGIRRIRCGPYAVSGTHHRSILSEIVPFQGRLLNFSWDDWREAQDVKILDHTLPQKEKDPPLVRLLLWEIGRLPTWQGFSFGGKVSGGGGRFTIIDDDDMTKDVMLGMKFCKKYASCQMIMKKFALGDKCEQIMEDE